MRKFLEWIKQEESGQGMVEYALIVAIVVGFVLLVSASGLGGKITTLFTNIGNKITDNTPT